MNPRKLSPSSSFRSLSPDAQPPVGRFSQQHVSDLVHAVEKISLKHPPDASPDDLIGHLDHIKTSARNDAELVNGLRLKVPHIRTSEQFSRYVDTVLEFKYLPGMDGVAHQLIVLADQESQTYKYPQDLIDCVTRPLAEQYPDPYPIDRFLQAHEGTGESLVQEFMKPRHTWGATTIGRPWFRYEPPGLVNGLMQLLPRLSAPELVELLNVLRARPNASDKVTDLFAATLARVIDLIDKGPTDQDRPRRIEQVLTRLSPAPTAKRHAIIQEPRFPGIQQELERLTKRLDDELEAIRRGGEPRTTKTFDATRRFFFEVLALLPHVQDVSDLGLLEAVARLAPAEVSSAATSYLHALNRQKLEWALGLPCAVSKAYPKVDEATNALLLLLVTPKVSLSRFAQSAQRPDIQTVEGLRTALESISIDKPSKNDEILLNALNDGVREVLQICCGDDQARALVLAMIAALKDRPQDQVEQLHIRVLGRLGLTQATPPLSSLTPVPRTVSPDKATQGMPGGQTISQNRASAQSPSINAPREVFVSSFIRDVEQAVFDYLQPSNTQGQGNRKGNTHHNQFNEKLVSLVQTLSTQRELDTLRQALQWLPSYWKHNRLIEQIVLRYQRVCKDRNIPATALNAKRLDQQAAMGYLASVLPQG